MTGVVSSFEKATRGPKSGGKAGAGSAEPNLLEGQNRILRLIAGGTALPEVLDAVARLCERIMPDALCSILLADSELALRHGAAPSLAPSYCAAIDGVRAGPGVGSCGTAVAERRLVVVSDIESHAYWRDYKHVALTHGLKACWSNCILGRDRRALGSFAVYYREPREPSVCDLEVIDSLKDLAAIAIERHETDQRQAALIEDLSAQRRRAEAAMARFRDSDQRFRDLTAASSDFYWEQDEALRFTFMSSPGLSVSGDDATTLYGKTWREIRPLGFADEEMRRHEAVLAARQPFRDLRIQQTDAAGALRYLSINGVPVFDIASGAFKGYRGTGRDISEEVRTAETFRAIIDAIPAMINAKDPSGRYMLMNAYQARLYGTTPAAAVGRTAGDLLGRDYGAYTGGIDQQVIETGHSTGFFEESYAGADGVKRHWLTAKLPLKDARGTVQHVISIAMDITALKESEQQLRASERALSEAIAELQQSNRAKSNFLASMSHELRTPLNAIIGFSEIMAQELLGKLGTDRYKIYAEDIHRSGRYLHDLITDMLDMAKIEAGKRDLVLEPIDPAAEIQDSVRMIGPKAAAGDVAVTVDLEQAPATIVADVRAFRQILLNLLSNAVKFTPPRGHVVVAMDRQDGAVRLKVFDTGVGIPPEQIGRLGVPFFRIESSLQARTEGFGLGLALTKSLVRLQGWSIRFDSTVGQGTVVTVTMPPGKPAAA